MLPVYTTFSYKELIACWQISWAPGGSNHLYTEQFIVETRTSISHDTEDNISAEAEKRYAQGAWLGYT